jgi:hypothetical protein
MAEAREEQVGYCNPGDVEEVSLAVALEVGPETIGQIRGQGKRERSMAGKS